VLLDRLKGLSYKTPDFIATAARRSRGAVRHSPPNLRYIALYRLLRAFSTAAFTRAVAAGSDGVIL
jgi:hypothetical protein